MKGFYKIKITRKLHKLFSSFIKVLSLRFAKRGISHILGLRFISLIPLGFKLKYLNFHFHLKMWGGFTSSTSLRAI